MPLSMHSFVSALHAFTAFIGKTCRWFSLAMVVVTCLVVILRYAFDYSSIAMQETVMYLHASLFMFGAAYTWQQQGHVRVDVLYHKWPAAIQQRVDLFGTLFLLLPTCLFLIYISWDYVLMAWANGEKSHEAGGLPFVYLLKTLIVVLPILLLVQATTNVLASLFNIPLSNTDDSSPAQAGGNS
ncbi:Tripartite ATP-independent periplasmic transporter [Oleispira antarctica RB-8]|uniref:TRAP transporter small permease protein n=1 Tax=Oleispira antarctica RB-8 TaxID=698738 RepID=R4YSI6_OLEAN|nr:Tripartite ATP-independent periplasmic transporter [Oleispira antarctica RB-8]